MSKKLQKSEEFSPIFNRIIDLSELRGITVSNLLDEFTTSRSTINAWKNGNINIAIIPDIAKRLGVSIEYLLTGADEPGIKYDFGNN
ncbi:MAG: helix-turn-helix domain-containing protein, partial [Ruminococcus sp.]